MGAEDQLFQKFGKNVSAGTVLFHDGDSGNNMYVIQSGKVKISKKIGEAEKTLAILPAGEFFGEMAILNNEPRTATAEVVEDSKLLLIDPQTFEAMLKGNSEIAIRMIKKLAQRLKQADEQIENLMIKDNNSRVINTLTKMAENEGIKTDDGIKINLSLKELALKTGIELNKIEKITDKLKNAKLISIFSDSIIVSDVGKLRKYLEFLTLKEQFGDL